MTSTHESKWYLIFSQLSKKKSHEKIKTNEEDHLSASYRLLHCCQLMSMTLSFNPIMVLYENLKLQYVSFFLYFFCLQHWTAEHQYRDIPFSCVREIWNMFQLELNICAYPFINLFHKCTEIHLQVERLEEKTQKNQSFWWVLSSVRS